MFDINVMGNAIPCFGVPVENDSLLNLEQNLYCETARIISE